MKIDYDSIMETIGIQFKEILYNDAYYNGYQIKIAKEQDFNRAIDKDPRIIYIVVKFGAASLNYRQYLLPVTIYALSEQNKLDACQRLLLDYCVMYNLTMNDEQTIKQFYSSPQVISNFEEVYYGYRSMLYMQGTFLVSKDSNPKKFYFHNLELKNLGDDIGEYTFDRQKFISFCKSSNISWLNTKHTFVWDPNYNVFNYSNDDEDSRLEGVSMDIEQMAEIGLTFEETFGDNVSFEISDVAEEIEVIDYQTTCDIMLDSQPFYNSNNFSRSIGKIGTYLLNLTMYLVDTPFLSIVQAIPDEDLETAPAGVNTTFYIETKKVKSGHSIIKKLKLVNVVDRGSIGEFPMITMVFSQ